MHVAFHFEDNDVLVGVTSPVGMPDGGDGAEALAAPLRSVEEDEESRVYGASLTELDAIAEATLTTDSLQEALAGRIVSPR